MMIKNKILINNIIRKIIYIILLISVNLIADNNFNFKEYKEIKTSSDYNNSVNKTFKFMSDINQKLYYINDDLYKNKNDKRHYTNISLFNKISFIKGSIYNSLVIDDNKTITHNKKNTQYYKLSYKNDNVEVFSNNDYSNKLYEFKYINDYNKTYLNDMGKYTFENDNSKAYEVLESYENEQITIYNDTKFTDFNSFIANYSNTDLNNSIIKNKLTNENVYFSSNRTLIYKGLTSNINVGTYDLIDYTGSIFYNNLTTISELDNTSSLEVLILHSTITGINQNKVFVLHNGIVKQAEYIKSNSAYSKLYYNIEAMKEIYSNISLDTNIKKTISKGWTYTSIPTKMILCDSTIQTQLLNICHQTYTLNNVFPSDKINVVLRNKNSKWTYWDSNLTINPRYKINKFIALSSEDGILIQAKKDTTINLPYDIFTADDNFNFVINRTGWKLLTVNEKHTLKNIEDKITLLGKKATHIYVYRNNTWKKYIPAQNIKDMEYINQYETFWVYTELNHIPVITNQSSYDIYENNKNVFTVQAFDNDNNTLIYSIGANSSAIFDIDSSTGKITFKDIAQNDYETTSSYTVKVLVNDGTNTISKDIKVKVLDVVEIRRTQDNSSSNIEEDLSSMVTTSTDVFYGNEDHKSIQLTNLENYLSPLFYSFTDRDYDCKNRHIKDHTAFIKKEIFVNSNKIMSFKIKTTNQNATRDVIVANNNFRLVYESVYFRASKCGGSSHSSINRHGETPEPISSDKYYEHITVNNKWQEVSLLLEKGKNTIYIYNSPEPGSDLYVDDFKYYNIYNVNENVAIGTIVGNINIEEPYTLSLKNDYGKFKLLKDGNITTIGSLDYEDKNLYELELVKYGDINSLTNQKLYIEITNVNDNIAVFDSNITNISVNENTHYITTASGTDKDVNTLFYSLSGDDNESFYINEATGRIDSKDILDYESKNKYNIIVNIFDLNNTVSKDLNIFINDINTATWDFQSDSDIYIDENSNYDINLSLINENNTSDFSYTLSGNDMGYFDISSKGILSFKKIPDYEKKTSYSITVNAKNDNISIDKSKAFKIIINNKNDLLFNEEYNINISKSKYLVKEFPNNLNYTIVNKDDAEFFHMVKNNLLLKNSVSVEVPIAYFITININNGISSVDKDITINFN